VEKKHGQLKKRERGKEREKRKKMMKLKGFHEYEPNIMWYQA
jgi:hypothetical protein